MKQYLQSSSLIEQHNARYRSGLESYEMGHNEYSDWSIEELKEKKMGVGLPSDIESLTANATRHVSSRGYNSPASLDWRVFGAVQGVKNQQQCGSCFVFSALGALETAHWRKYRVLPDLAEQHAVDCSQANGCSGGWMGNVYDWIKRNNGVTSQRSYPYKGVLGSCLGGKLSAAKVHSHTLVQNERDLLNAVATIGTVAVIYDASPREHSLYKGGVLDIPNCPRGANHAVLLVGYGNENGKDYWLLKNSWGTTWGEGGYFKLRRGNNMCGVADWGIYPTAA